MGIIEATGLIKQRNGKDWKGEVTEKAGMPGLGTWSCFPLFSKSGYCLSVFLLLCAAERTTLGQRLGRRERTSRKDLETGNAPPTAHHRAVGS